MLFRYGVLNLILDLAALLYLVVVLIHSARAQTSAVQMAIENRQRITGLEQRLDRLDEALEKLDIAQRLTRIEGYIQTAQQMDASNREMLRALVVGVLIILIEAVMRATLAIRAGRNS